MKSIIQPNIIYMLALTGIWLLGGPNNVFAQQAEYIKGEIIVQFVERVDIQQFIGGFKKTNIDIDLKPDRLLSRRMNIWKLKYDTSYSEQSVLEALNRQKDVIHVQRNHIVELRSTTPNDRHYYQNWDHFNTGQGGGTIDADMDTNEAWDITTGGVTASGDTIVVAVIEALFENNFEVSENRWLNHHEIPDNGIDDDENGFVDDYMGWYPFDNSDNIPLDNFHASAVAAIIGARGDNGEGHAGVCWNVKMMSVLPHDLTLPDPITEAGVIAAYNYPLEMRILYNETNGEKGAFVVATNASWGVENVFASEMPIWCSLYDTLGAHGILNVGAVANTGQDIDIQGDMPGTCSSDYLVTVGASNHHDQKSAFSAYGLEHVDLLAPGEQAPFVGLGGGVGSGFIDGTSVAAPEVTGTIALLYALPCTQFSEAALNEPAEVAAQIRQYILGGEDVKPALQGLVATNGRLNVYNSMKLQIADYCEVSDCLPPHDMEVDLESTGTLLSWSGNSPEGFSVRYRLFGTEEWTEVITDVKMFHFLDLMPCALYEYQIKSNCSNDYGSSNTFFSEGCGECQDLVYCVPKTVEGTFITNFIFGDIDNSSMFTNPGRYDFYYDVSTDLEIGQEYPFTIGINGIAASFEMDLRMWIDFDANGTFENEELVYDSPIPSENVEVQLSGMITIPLGLTPGSKRMRLFVGDYANEGPCGSLSINFGEIEDYCINVTDVMSAAEDVYSQDFDIEVFPNPLVGSSQVLIDAPQSGQYILELYTSTGQKLHRSMVNVLEGRNYFSLNELLPETSGGLYFLSLLDRSGVLLGQKKVIKHH